MENLGVLNGQLMQYVIWYNTTFLGHIKSLRGGNEQTFSLKFRNSEIQKCTLLTENEKSRCVPPNFKTPEQYACTGLGSSVGSGLACWALLVASSIPGLGRQQSWGGKHDLHAPSSSTDLNLSRERRVPIFWLPLKNPHVVKIIRSPTLWRR